jgi:hypothetical protein
MLRPFSLIFRKSRLLIYGQIIGRVNFETKKRDLTGEMNRVVAGGERSKHNVKSICRCLTKAAGDTKEIFRWWNRKVEIRRCNPEARQVVNGFVVDGQNKLADAFQVFLNAGSPFLWSVAEERVRLQVRAIQIYYREEQRLSSRDAAGDRDGVRTGYPRQEPDRAYLRGAAVLSFWPVLRGSIMR